MPTEIQKKSVELYNIIQDADYIHRYDNALLKQPMVIENLTVFPDGHMEILFANGSTKIITPKYEFSQKLGIENYSGHVLRSAVLANLVCELAERIEVLESKLKSIM